MAERLPWLIRRGALWSVQPRGSSLRSVPAHLPVRFTEIQGRDIEALLDAAAQIDPIAPDAILRRFDEGRRCFAGWVEGRVAAYGWITFGPEWVGEFERQVQARPGEAYIWDCATLPHYRRRGLYSALLGAITEQLCLEDIERAWIIGMLSSPVMLRAFAKAGFQPIARLTYARLFKARILLLSADPGISRAQKAAVRCLLAAGCERAAGPVIAGYSAPATLPATHYS